MPQYYQCSKCLYSFEGFEGYDTGEPQDRDCPSCKDAKGKIMYHGSGSTSAAVMKDYEAFKSPVTGGMIDGKRALREHLKETGCRIVDPSEAKSHGISN